MLSFFKRNSSTPKVTPPTVNTYLCHSLYVGKESSIFDHITGLEKNAREGGACSIIPPGFSYSLLSTQGVVSKDSENPEVHAVAGLCDALVFRVVGLGREVHEKNQKITRLEQENFAIIENLQNNVTNKFMVDIEKLENDMKSLLDEKTELENELLLLKSRLKIYEDLEETREEAIVELMRSKQDCEQEKVALEKQVKVLNSGPDVVSTKIQVLQETIKELYTKIEQLQTEIEEKEKKCKTNLNELDGYKKRQSKLEEKVEELTKDNDNTKKVYEGLFEGERKTNQEI